MNGNHNGLTRKSKTIYQAVSEKVSATVSHPKGRDVIAQLNEYGSLTSVVHVSEPKYDIS